MQKAHRDPEAATPEGIERSGFAAFGSPEAVAHRLAAFAAIGVDELLGIFDFGGLDPAEVDRSVGSVAREWNRAEAAPTGRTPR